MYNLYGKTARMRAPGTVLVCSCILNWTFWKVWLLLYIKSIKKFILWELHTESVAVCSSWEIFWRKTLQSLGLHLFLTRPLFWRWPKPQRASVSLWSRQHWDDHLLDTLNFSTRTVMKRRGEVKLSARSQRRAQFCVGESSLRWIILIDWTW